MTSRVALVALVAVVAFIALLPGAAAEWGEYGADGWPIDVDGRSVNPFPQFSAAELDALLDAYPGDPLNQVAGTTIYPYWPILSAEVLRMAQDHPDRIRLYTAGKSTAGLDLYMLEIADFDQIEAGAGLPLEEREVVWVDGGHHSNEYSGVYFSLAWAQFLVEDYGLDEDATWIVENRHTWIMPMVNPDGSHAFGRLNAHGVNINRNYPVIWDGEGHDEVMNNRGPAPASEIETQVNIEWFNKTRPDYYASVHCCGNLWLYPYGEEGLDPIDQQTLSRICDEAFAEIRQRCGPIWSTIYPASGSSVDTAYEYAGIPAFGYEMSGRGAVSLWGQPLTNEQVRTQEYESWNGLLHAFLNVHVYGAYPVVTAVEADGDDLLVTVQNQGYGNMSRGAVEGHYYPSAHLDSWGGTELPPLGVNETATVRVKAYPAPAGETSILIVHYAKRLIETTNVGHKVVPLAFSDDPGAMPPEGGFLVRTDSTDGAQESPTVGVLLVLLALVGLALVRRR